jgi:arsenate reductase
LKQTLYQIYHNSRCSKSRKALELLRSKTENYKIIKYLEVGINENDLELILDSKDISKDDLIRKNEITFKKLNINKIELNENQIKKLILENPILLQRPIITKYRSGLLVKSMIGRPPELVKNLFD